MLPIQAARLKAQRTAAAGEKFKQHPQFSRVQNQIYEASAKLAEQHPPPLQRLSTESWECATLLFNVHAKAYLTMVDDMPLLDAYCIVLESFARRAWEQHTGFSVALAAPDDLLYFQQLIGFWKNEGHKRLANAQAQPDTTATTGRKGYRTEVKDWMKRETIATVEQAARKLGVSTSTLKSIMSDRGEKRYGDDKLKIVLDKILPKQG